MIISMLVLQNWGLDLLHFYFFSTIGKKKQWNTCIISAIFFAPYIPLLNVIFDLLTNFISFSCASMKQSSVVTAIISRLVTFSRS